MDRDKKEKEVIGLYYGDIGDSNGPAKVAKNLVAGLEELGHEIRHNSEGDLNGCLQSWCDRRKYLSLPKETLMGPNLMVLPHEDVGVWRRHTHFVTPSDWARNSFLMKDRGISEITKNSIIDVWSVGIETDRFRPSLDVSPDFDCLIYFKKREQEEFQEVLEELKKRNLKVAVMQYGHYKSEDLISACNRTRFTILLTGTESQGIGYMEMLSMNQPCYVYNTNVREDYGIPVSYTHLRAHET